VDSYGRDLHLLEAEVAAADLEAADADIQELIACIFWIAAAEPVAGE
jgi:hypothetical protein